MNTRIKLYKVSVVLYGATTDMFVIGGDEGSVEFKINSTAQFHNTNVIINSIELHKEYPEDANMLEIVADLLKLHSQNGALGSTLNIDKNPNHDENDHNRNNLRPDLPPPNGDNSPPNLSPESRLGVKLNDNNKYRDAKKLENQDLNEYERPFSQEGKELFFSDMSALYDFSKKEFYKEVNKLIEFYVKKEAFEKASYIRDIKHEIENNNG